MKKLFYLIVFISNVALAPPGKPLKTQIEKEDHILEAVLIIETTDDSTKINIIENAVGLIQIRPVMVHEANRIIGYSKYKLIDRYSTKKSIEMWYVVQTYWNPTYNLEIACRVWNAGNTYSVKPDVLNYITKVKKQYDKIKSQNHTGKTYWGSGRFVSFSAGKRKEFTV